MSLLYSSLCLHFILYISSWLLFLFSKYALTGITVLSKQNNILRQFKEAKLICINCFFYTCYKSEPHLVFPMMTPSGFSIGTILNTNRFLSSLAVAALPAKSHFDPSDITVWDLFLTEFPVPSKPDQPGVYAAGFEENTYQFWGKVPDFTTYFYSSSCKQHFPGLILSYFHSVSISWNPTLNWGFN